MGAFLTSVQARSSRSSADAIAALREHFASRGIREPQEGEAADRTILVESGDGWISVYDEESEGQSLDVLGEVASVLSRAFGDTMTVLVHDSDVLLLELWSRGERADTFDSAPDYFEHRSKAERARVAGRPELWKSLLSGDATVDALREAWAAKKLFAEETLRATASLFGLAPERAAIGYRYADKEDARYARLTLRSVKRPASEKRADGATRFELHAHGNELEASCGMPAQLSLGVRNEGGASRGVDIVLSGDAVKAGLLDVTSAELVVGVPQKNVRFERPFERRDDALVARFDDVEIPPGLAGGFAALAGLTPQKMVEAMYASALHVNVRAKGNAAGAGALVVAFVPHLNASGALAHTMALRVGEAPRRPLRARADVDAHGLRQLEDGRYLFAQVSLDRDRAVAAKAIAPMLASRARFFDAESLSIAIHPARFGDRPRTGKAKAAGFFSSKRWRTLETELATDRVVDLRGARGGFTFGTHLIGRDIDDRELPTLAMWIDTAGFDASRFEEARATLTQLADDAIALGGVQGVLTRWGTIPTLDYTAYELACGIHGQCTLYRSWLVRWVRGVGDGILWVGRELAAHVDRAALERCARVTERDGALRIEIDGHLDDIERALAAALPSQEEWTKGVGRLYGR